jgi:cytosine/adenosine deaminase-related metal-dependent hydrolase
VADRRLVIRSGRVITADRSLGEFDRADVLVEGTKIVAVGQDLGVAGDAEVLDVAGKIVLPGLVDTHRHLWQTPLRGACSNLTLFEYFGTILDPLSAAYTPEDIYAATYAGALEALGAGVTTVLDYCHCVNSPEHADAAVAALRDSGIRAMYGYGYRASNVPEPAFGDQDARIRDARRIRSEHFGADESLLSMAIALNELELVDTATSRREIYSARELGVPMTLHSCALTSPVLFKGVERLHDAGLLGQDMVHAHCNAITDHELRLLAEQGGHVSITPETEMQMGLGFPITGRALAHGLRPTLGVDIVSNNSGDLFTQMRLALQVQRALDNDVHLREHRMADHLNLQPSDVIEFATIDGANALGLASRIGSLSPGKEADIVILDTRRINLAPVNDAAATIVLQASPADVETVLVAGRVVKRDGQLVGVDLARTLRLVEEARDRLLAGKSVATGAPQEVPEVEAP